VALCFPWFLSFGNRTQNSRVAGASLTTSPSGDLSQPSGDLEPTQGGRGLNLGMCVFITAVPITKLFAWGGVGDNGGHVLRETTIRSLCGLVCPSRTSERGGEGYCVKGGGGEEGERERERAREVRLHYSLGYSGSSVTPRF
jgi:hypothetical protein